MAWRIHGLHLGGHDGLTGVPDSIFALFNARRPRAGIADPYGLDDGLYEKVGGYGPSGGVTHWGSLPVEPRTPIAEAAE